MSSPNLRGTAYSRREAEERDDVVSFELWDCRYETLLTVRREPFLLLIPGGPSARSNIIKSLVLVRWFSDHPKMQLTQHASERLSLLMAVQK